MTEASPRPLAAPDNLATARRAQDEFGLCDHCLGRLFAKVETGLRNDERAGIIRGAAPDLERVPVPDCFVCEGLFDELDEFADLAVEALSDFEHDTYLVGTRVDEDVFERERDAWETLNVASSAEAINSSLNREIGRRVMEKTGKDASFKDPHVTAIVDTRFNVVDVEHAGLYLYARYRKFDRTLPQTVWTCRVCRGRGCKACEGTGKRYETSVQELIETVPKEVTGATEAAFHGAGREDIDARAIGTGRPFVLELKDPRKRDLDVASLEQAINAHTRPRVEIEGLRVTNKKEVARVKEHRGAKTYRAEVTFGDPVQSENLFKAVAELRGRTIAQRTPSRVSHRRADLVRKRRVLKLDVDEVASPTEAALLVKGDAGLYIKELISGDEGRTDPSLAGLLGVDATVTALDVVDVEYDPQSSTAKKA